MLNRLITSELVRASGMINTLYELTEEDKRAAAKESTGTSHPACYSKQSFNLGE